MTGSRSVTTRIVKRGGMEMEGMVKGEVGDGEGTEGEAGVKETRAGGGVE